MPIKQCHVRPGHDCWECVDALREMIQRQATGATVHRLNNQLMSVVAACQNQNEEHWKSAVTQFLHIIQGEK